MTILKILNIFFFDAKKLYSPLIKWSKRSETWRINNKYSSRASTRRIFFVNPPRFDLLDHLISGQT